MRIHNEEKKREARAQLGIEAEGSRALAGLPVFLTGWIALGATAALAEENEAVLSARFHPDMVRGAKTFAALAERLTLPEGLILPRSVRVPLTGCGVLAGLWQLTGELCCGMDVDLKAIPVRQESIEICEYMDLDPYSLSSAGACLIAAANGDRTGAALTKAGIPFAVIGHLADGNDCILHFADRIRYLNRP